MKKKATRIVMVIAVIALAITCIMFKVQPQKESAAQLKENSIGASTAIASHPQEKIQLPPEDTPFRLTVNGLRARVLKGDADAACRLAMEYQKCNLAKQQVDHADDVLSQVRSGGEDMLEVALPLDHSKFYSTVSHCAGVDEVNATETARIWRISAENGNVAAMVNYAGGNAFSVASTLDTAEELIVYRKIAPRISRAAINRGSGVALLSLAAAYQPENQIGFRSYLSQSVHADIQESLTLYKMARIASAGGDEEMIQFINEQISKIDRRASALQRAESDRDASKRVNAIGDIRLPSSRAIPWLRVGSTPNIEIKDCGS